MVKDFSFQNRKTYATVSIKIESEPKKNFESFLQVAFRQVIWKETLWCKIRTLTKYGTAYREQIKDLEISIETRIHFAAQQRHQAPVLKVSSCRERSAGCKAIGAGARHFLKNASTYNLKRKKNDFYQFHQFSLLKWLILIKLENVCQQFLLFRKFSSGGRISIDEFASIGDIRVSILIMVGKIEHHRFVWYERRSNVIGKSVRVLDILDDSLSHHRRPQISIHFNIYRYLATQLLAQFDNKVEFRETILPDVMKHESLVFNISTGSNLKSSGTGTNLSSTFKALEHCFLPRTECLVVNAECF